MIWIVKEDDAVEENSRKNYELLLLGKTINSDLYQQLMRLKQDRFKKSSQN